MIEVRVALGPGAAETPEDRKRLLVELFSHIKTATAKEDLLLYLRTRLLVHMARKLKCQKIFTAENATRMAIKIMSLTSKGRGYTLPFETTFQDDRFPGVLLLRPMKDTLSKEVGIFNNLHKISSLALPSFTTLDPNPKASIDHLTEGQLLFSHEIQLLFSARFQC